MRLVRFHDQSRVRPGLVGADGAIGDLSDHVADLAGSALDPDRLRSLAAIDPGTLVRAPADATLAAPVAGIGKIVCIGLNYHDHAAEVGKTAPDEPMLFLKATSSVCGPFDPIEIPKDAARTDWETELGIVIGRRAKNIGAETAHDHIAGFVVANDVSERAFQAERAGQFTKGKSHDTFCPLGPWLVVSGDEDAVPPRRVWTEVNGRMMQDGTTADMVFDVTTSIAYISQFMTLEPGDIVLTGTPAGVGKGIRPEPVYLREGDRLRCGIEGLGEQDHTMIAVRP